MMRWLRRLGAALLLCTISVWSCVLLLSHDLPDPGDADLAARHSELAADDNALTHLKRAAALSSARS